MYPHQDPNGFLDVAMRLYEDDGNYAKVGEVMQAAGNTVVSVSGGNPYVAIAGGVLFIAGSIVSIASAVDEDDDLGTTDFTYLSAQDLETRVGVVNRDFTQDDADYDVSFELIGTA
jgi:hypothetical protein